ncbi:MAG: hypothetical protein FWE98_00935 [Oscillospiraceae bacterium]|nr:hypothetical protein [Oscillospiraceae bacterium]
MKKTIAFFIAALLALALSACGDNKPTTTSPTTQSGGKPAQSELYFAPKGVRMEIGAPPAPALEALEAALGAPLDELECKSCAQKAKDINYNYDGFALTVTYPEQGEDYISGIDLSNDKYSIPGGITIGSTAEALFAAYGTDYEEENGHYYFKKGMSILHVAVANGKLSLIAFEYDWDNA